MLVFEDPRRHAEFYRIPRFPFLNPPSMKLEYGIDLLGRRNGFSLQKSPFHLIQEDSAKFSSGLSWLKWLLFDPFIRQFRPRLGRAFQDLATDFQISLDFVGPTGRPLRCANSIEEFRNLF